VKLKVETRDDGRHIVTFGGAVVDGVRSVRIDASGEDLAVLRLDVIWFDVDMGQGEAKGEIESSR